jgi:hypothetical protein
MLLDLEAPHYAKSSNIEQVFSRPVGSYETSSMKRTSLQVAIAVTAGASSGQGASACSSGCKQPRPSVSYSPFRHFLHARYRVVPINYLIPPKQVQLSSSVPPVTMSVLVQHSSSPKNEAGDADRVTLAVVQAAGEALGDRGVLRDPLAQNQDFSARVGLGGTGDGLGRGVSTGWDDDDGGGGAGGERGKGEGEGLDLHDGGLNVLRLGSAFDSRQLGVEGGQPVLGKRGGRLMFFKEVEGS